MFGKKKSQEPDEALRSFTDRLLEWAAAAKPDHAGGASAFTHGINELVRANRDSARRYVETRYRFADTPLVDDVSLKLAELVAFAYRHEFGDDGPMRLVYGAARLEEKEDELHPELRELGKRWTSANGKRRGEDAGIGGSPEGTPEMSEALRSFELGQALAQKGALREAIGHLEAALPTFRKLGRRDAEAGTLNTLGALYRDTGQLQQAIERLERALAIAKELADPVAKKKAERMIRANMGESLLKLGKPRRAIEHYEKVLLMTRQLGERHEEGACLNALGVASRDLGLIEAARGYFQEALSIAREMGDHRAEASVLTNLGGLGSA